MRHLYLAIHYPKPESVGELLEAMSGFGVALGQVPGMLEATAWRDKERIVAFSIWASGAAFDAAMPALADAVADVPFEQWEARPRELFRLDEVAPPGA